MSITEIRQQAESAIDDAYAAGFEAALEALRNWRNSIEADPEYAGSEYFDGINDSVITLEQEQGQ